MTDQQSPFHGSDSAEVQPKTFGVIGAYDGHATDMGLGRVAVDSTWHHFFDLNLIGDPGAVVGGDYTAGGVAPDSTKLHGFQSTPPGRRRWRRLKRITSTSRCGSLRCLVSTCCPHTLFPGHIPTVGIVCIGSRWPRINCGQRSRFRCWCGREISIQRQMCWRSAR